LELSRRGLNDRSQASRGGGMPGYDHLVPKVALTDPCQASKNDCLVAENQVVLDLGPYG